MAKTYTSRLLNIVQCIGIVVFSVSCSVNSSLNNSEKLNKEEVEIRDDFKKYFDECHVDGSVAIFDSNRQKWYLSDTVDVKKETLPASTFKIINLLIALETETIQDEYEVVKWPGKTDTIKYGFRPDIYHDMTVKEAFEVSAGWVFIELAKKIGKEKYKKYLTRSHYGNLDLSQTEADFWNFGKFGVSPVDQVQLMKNLYTENLPFSKRNIEIVKRVMITEKNENFTILSKTGWTRDAGINTGWWVGSIENRNGAYFFATRLLQDRTVNRSDFGACRKEITKAVLKDLSILK